MTKKKRWLSLICAAACAVLTACASASSGAASPPTPTSTPAASAPADSWLSVRFIDVGQADAALVNCDGSYMLIDGGNKADSQVIYTVLKNEGAEHLELVVGTHAHEDHIGGLPGAFAYADAAVTLCPVTDYDSEAFRDFKRYAEEKGNGLTVPAAGDVYPLGSSAVTILGLNEGSGTNDSSIVLRVDYGAYSFLFTGDAERPAEQMLLDGGAELSATVLKVGHHGSDTSTTYPFLREIMPQIAVISVGENNSYGHPDENVLSRLRDAGAEIYRTDQQGDIVITVDGNGLTTTFGKTVPASPPAAETAQPTEQPTPQPTATPQPAEATQQADYIANRNSEIFHRPDCASVQQMKESNKLYFYGTREELLAQGYTPCKRCSP